MKKIEKLKRSAIILFFVYFIIGVVTLPRYGINWDTINHLPRGQSYLNYFLTGSKNFSNLPEFKRYWQDPETIFFSPLDKQKEDVERVSLYHDAGLDYTYFVDNDGGHPPLSDIISSYFNHILFQKLGLINDIDSYRIYSVMLASVTVAVVFYWTAKNTSIFAGIVAALSLSVYPLFWSEMHFNSEKDVPQTAFWTLLLFSMWNAVHKKSKVWNVLSGIFLGLAIGTKFNIVFVPFVIIPWYLFLLFREKVYKKPLQYIKNNYLFLCSLLLIPLIGIILFVLSWPFLWADPIGRVQIVTNYYTDIGLTTSFDKRFLLKYGFNSYPLYWISVTTPLIILFFSSTGVIKSLFSFTRENKTSYFKLLVLLWLFVPIVRVTWPGMTIYGGIRQIMEYTPALSVMAGIGAATVRDALDKKISSRILSIVLIMLFIPHLAKLASIHPNENVYFNSLIGGLKGAKERSIPSWGNSFGAAYRQGVIWINENVEEDSQLVYARELIPNIPYIWLRPDLRLNNAYRSGYLRNGEYVIALTYDGTKNTSYYDRYLENFVSPLYNVEVDDVSILKVWQNEDEHLDQRYILDKELFEYEISDFDEGVEFDFQEVVHLSRIEVDFETVDCSELVHAYVELSNDGLHWNRLPGVMPREDWSVPEFGHFPMEDYYMIPFVADEARLVRLYISPHDACIGNIVETKVFYFN